jgi:hypothetical protein
LDGFEEIEIKKSYQLSALFEVLPFGLKNFKFIISEKDGFVKKCFLEDYKTLKVYPYLFMKFSFDEASRYLEDLSLEKFQISEILKITNSLPGRIKVITEAFKDGKLDFNDIDSINSFAELMEKHWDKVDSENPDVLTLLALIAFEKKNSLNFISEIVGKSIEHVKDLIENIPFLKLDNNSVEFDSPTFEQFTRNKLSNLKNKVAEIVLSALINDSDSVESIIELPRRLEQAKKYDSILKYMTHENFKIIIDSKESLSFLEEQTLHGINAAKELENPIALFSLTLQKSCISEVKKTYVWKSEIEAKIELKDFESAFDLASQSILKEEKFKLFTLIARKKKEKGLVVEQSTLDVIEALYSQINICSYFGEDETIEIASHLMFTFPNLALDIVEGLSNTGIGDRSDLGFAKLAMLMRGDKGNQLGDNETLDKINLRIKSANVRNFTNAFTFLFNDETASTFILKCKSLNSSTEKLNIVRIYLSEHPKANNIDDVIEFGLDILLLASAEISISSTILKELSFPLRYVTNQQKIVGLSNKFHSLKQIAREKGPTINNVKFLLNLAIVDVIYNHEKGNNDLYEIFSEIDNQLDLGIKTECLAIFYSYIFRVYETSVVPKFFNLNQDILPIIETGFVSLINNVSRHLMIAAPILSELALVNPKEAIKLCKRLNTRSRRDNAFLVCLKSYLNNDVENIDSNYFELFYKPIIDVKLKNQVASIILNKYANSGLSSDLLNKNFLLDYVGKISDFFNNTDKCYSYIDSISILYTIIKDESIISNLLSEIKTYLNDLNDRYQKIEYGFMISATLIQFNKPEAVFFHDSAEDEKKILEFDSPLSLTLFYNSIRLCIKSLEGIASTGADCEEHVETLIEYINVLPSVTTQKSLIGEIIFVLYRNNKNDLSQKIYDKNIKPFISSLLKLKNGLSGSETFDIVCELSPIAYIFNVIL